MKKLILLAGLALCIEACHRKDEDRTPEPDEINVGDASSAPSAPDLHCPEVPPYYDNPDSILKCSLAICGKILIGCDMKEGGSSKILKENPDKKTITYGVEVNCSYVIDGYDNDTQVFLRAGDESSKVPVWCKHASDFVQYTVTGHEDLVIDVSGMSNKTVIGRVDLKVRNITSN